MENHPHTKASPLIWGCALAGALAAFVFSLIPCVSWLPLMIIEVYMLIQLVKMYDYQLDAKLIFTIFIVLLGISAILSVIVGELVALLSFMTLAPIVKPIVAALVIWGLGEGAVYVLERYGE